MNHSPQYHPDSLAGLLAACARLAEREDFNSERWQAALQRAVGASGSPPTPMPTALETGLAERLVQGWQPGNDLLLLAAADRFGWRADGARLAQLGKAGQLIGTALAEHDRFRLQATPTVNLQWATIRHMREGVGDSRQRIQRSLRYFRDLHRDFPAWLRMAAGDAAVQQWLALEAKSPQQIQHTYRLARGPLVLQGSVVFSILAILAWRTWGPDHRIERPRERATAYLVQTGNYKPSREWINGVLSRLRYQPNAAQAVPRRAGSYQVELTKLGNVAQVTVVQASSDPTFDAAAIQAIRASPGFPADIARTFTLTLHP